MKRHIAQLSAVLGVGLTIVLPLKASPYTYTFTDSSIQEGDMASVFIGDIISGTVEFYPATGNYTVTWKANPQALFMPPMQFILNLGNVSVGDVVSLSMDYNGSELIESFSYSGNEPALMDWMPGDILVTSGSVEEFGVSFESGIYSLFTNLPPGFGIDLLTHSGVLEGEIVPDEPILLDSDGDGLMDDVDPYPLSDMSPTVVLLGVDTGVPNMIPGVPVEESGTTLADVVLDLEQSAASSTDNHGQYVKELGQAFKLLERDGWINGRQRAGLLRVIAQSVN
ncbi:MAG: hypothetical protein AB3N64_07350 [Puniceicoccaceae bacterium]